MSDDEQRRWDERYSVPEYIFGEDPSALLIEHLDLLQSGGRALDIAAGEGKNAVFLAHHGFQVDAIDISSVGLRKARQLAARQGVTIKTMQRDVKQVYLPEPPFDLILCMHYLQRDLAPHIVEALTPGGVLIMELNTIDNLKLHRRPSLEHLLQPNELITWFSDRDLETRTYREGIFENHAVAQLVASKRP